MPDLTEALQSDIKSGMRLAGKAAYKGLVLMVDNFSNKDSFMASLEKIARERERKFEETGDIQYSYANVSVGELEEKGRVELVDEPVLKEVMSYFDKYCREYNIKYSALKETSEGKDGEAKEGYKVFFQGKDDKLIMDVIKSAYEDWHKDQMQMKEGESAKNVKQKSVKPSVLAKLAFFRDRVKETISNEADKDKAAKHDKVKQREMER